MKKSLRIQFVLTSISVIALVLTSLFYGVIALERMALINPDEGLLHGIIYNHGEIVYDGIFWFTSIASFCSINILATWLTYSRYFTHIHRLDEREKELDERIKKYKDAETKLLRSIIHND